MSVKHKLNDAAYWKFDSDQLTGGRWGSVALQAERREI